MRAPARSSARARSRTTIARCGSACLAERRTLEQIEHGKPVDAVSEVRRPRAHRDARCAAGAASSARSIRGWCGPDRVRLKPDPRLLTVGQASALTTLSAAPTRPARASAPGSTAAASARSATARSRACASGSAALRRAAPRLLHSTAPRACESTHPPPRRRRTRRVPNSAMFRYTSRMRCFGHSVSISTVKYASRPLRTQLCPGHRNRFFATCCEIVLAPRTRRPRSRSSSASLIDFRSKPWCVGKVLVFGGDHRDLHVRRDLRPVDPAMAQHVALT